MKSTERKLLLKVLCEMLPYEVICYHSYGKNLKGSTIGKLSGIHINKKDNYPYCIFENSAHGELIEQIRPYLRRMNSMSDKEKKQWMQIERANDLNLSIEWLDSHYFDRYGLINVGLAVEALDGIYDQFL